MRLLIIFGSILLLGVYADSADSVLNDIPVKYAKLKIETTPAAKTTLSLCNNEAIPDATAERVVELTIEDDTDPIEVKNVFGTPESPCYNFNITGYPELLEEGKNQHDIYLKITDTDDQPEKKVTVHEFRGKFTFKETNAESVGFKFYTSVNIVQFTNGNVPVFKVISNGPTTIIDQTSITCPDSPDICIHPHLTALTSLAIDQVVEIYNAVSDTIPISSPKTITDKDIITDCEGFADISIVYDNDDAQNGYTFTGDDATNACAVSGTEVFYNLVGYIKPNPTPGTFVVINNDECDEITAKVRDMKFLKPFDHTVEISWDVDAKNDDDPPSNEFYLEVSDNNQKTVIKNLHIDCSQDGLTTCIAYVFDEGVLNVNKTLNYELSEFNDPGAGKSKTKETYEYVQTTPTDDEKSLKALNLNQFEINWNTNQGKLCVEDSLYKETKISQYRYELVIGFAVGKWKKHIADYIDESTICFNNFEITQLIENKLGVHFLVMKRESDTNQIVASDMITTDLIVPEISEVNDETISLEFENLNSPFLIRDEKTKNIISKNEKKIHNLAFLKSSHENKSIFNKNLVLETRKEHTQMRVHFKIPQKVNAA